MLAMLVAGWFVHLGLRAREPLSPKGCLFSLDMTRMGCGTEWLKSLLVMID